LTLQLGKGYFSPANIVSYGSCSVQNAFSNARQPVKIKKTGHMAGNTYADVTDKQFLARMTKCSTDATMNDQWILLLSELQLVFLTGLKLNCNLIVLS
jgi:hypothetical protein